MKSELRVHFSDTDAYEMVDGLNVLFASQIRIMKYELRDKFLSVDGRKLPLGKSLGNHA